MLLTYKYRLLTSKRDHLRLAELVEEQRQLYNAALQERIDCYDKTGASISLYDQFNSLTECRNTLPDMAAIPANLQRGTLHRLDKAFKSFFKRVKKGEKPGFPRFKGKGWYDTLEFKAFDGITLRGKWLRSKAFGSIRVHFHRPLPDGAEIKSARIVRDLKGWYVCFSVRLPDVEKVTVQTSVGIDVGLTDLATLSTGIKIPSLRAARKAEKALRVAQRKLSRAKKGSNGRRKARESVARVHRKIKNVRDTYAHQVTARLVRDFDLIAVEDLKVKNLMKNRHLARSIADASWSDLIAKIAYKAEKAGKHLIKVDPSFTSQDCSGCGERVHKPLSQRVHRCTNCGLVVDRDENAAMNILLRGVVAPGAHNVAH